MKTLKDLTPEIRAKIEIYKNKCTQDLYSGVEFQNFNRKIVVEYIEKIFEITKRDKPVIIIANDPNDYKKKFAILQNEEVLKTIHSAYLEKNKEGAEDIEIDLDNLASNIKIDYDIKPKSHYLFLCSTHHRVYLTWYKFIQDEFKIDHSNKELLDWLYEHANNNISRVYITPMYVLVLRMPKYIRRNNVGFHSVNGPAIEWENYGMYYINGRKLSKEIFENVLNKKYTFDEFINEENEDIKASIISLIEEKFGNEELMKFLDATIVDEKTIKHSSNHIETVKLWKTKTKYSFVSDINGNPNQPYAWLELTCPSSGSKYLIPTSSHFEDAVECCKFHRPQQIPADMEYDFKMFNN